ncbi:MAG: hypothetical protein P8Y68_20160, partial [Anaerolineales bacterium]
MWPNRPPAAPDLGEMLAQVETFYTRRGAIPRYQMCPAAQPENLAQALEDRGFTFSAHTDVKTTDLDSLLAITKAPELEIVATPVLTEDWFAAYTTASGYKTERLPIRWGILTRVGPPAHFV